MIADAPRGLILNGHVRIRNERSKHEDHEVY